MTGHVGEEAVNCFSKITFVTTKYTFTEKRMNRKGERTELIKYALYMLRL